MLATWCSGRFLHTTAHAVLPYRIFSFGEAEEIRSGCGAAESQRWRDVAGTRRDDNEIEEESRRDIDREAGRQFDEEIETGVELS